jgi:predicted nucleotide-binding protein
MATGAPASVFISYSHADKDLARALAAVLQDRGVRIWIDEGELKVGDSIIERIATAIAEIDFFLVLVSESSRSSNWCRKELALAVSGELGREGVKVLPIRINGASMPDALADVYYLDLNAEMSTTSRQDRDRDPGTPARACRSRCQPTASDGGQLAHRRRFHLLRLLTTSPSA